VSGNGKKERKKEKERAAVTIDNVFAERII
jgi:hypothetical protein